MSCRPIVYSGLSDVSGSWNTAPISRPRTRRIASYGQIVDAAPGKADFAATDAPGRIDEPDDRGTGQRLAGARLADHAQDLARRERERDVVHRDERAVPRRELDAQPVDGEQRRCGNGACSWRERGSSGATLRPRAVSLSGTETIALTAASG